MNFNEGWHLKADSPQGFTPAALSGPANARAHSYQEAAAEFRKAVAAKPDSVPAHLDLGAALTQTGDLKEAGAQFEETSR